MADLYNTIYGPQKEINIATARKEKGALSQEGERAFEIASTLSEEYNALCAEEKGALASGAHLPQRCSPPKVVAMPDAEMTAMLGNKAYAAYFPRKDTVIVANSTLAHEYKTETLIHEMTHALQSRAAKKGSCDDPRAPVRGVGYGPARCTYYAEAEAYMAEKKHDAAIGKKWEFEGKTHPAQLYYLQAQAEQDEETLPRIGRRIPVSVAHFRDIKGALKTPGILFRK